jgi:CheY-like chemotaxis protein
MTKRLNCVMLIDDNPDDNFYHERQIKKSNLVASIIIKKAAREALNYLKSNDINELMRPDLIFLDINMPGMNGWEFLEEYDKLENKLKSRVVIVMLTTSDNPSDMDRAKHSVIEFKTKPLTEEMLKEIIDSYFA